jgi:hypothetical protein
MNEGRMMCDRPKIKYPVIFHPIILPSTWHFTDTGGFMIESDTELTWPSPWVSVSDRLPEKPTADDLKEVLLAYKWFSPLHKKTFSAIETSSYYGDDFPDKLWSVFPDYKDEDEVYEATHWMPIPPLPEEE